MDAGETRAYLVARGLGMITSLLYPFNSYNSLKNIVIILIICNRFDWFGSNRLITFHLWLENSAEICFKFI